MKCDRGDREEKKLNECDTHTPTAYEKVRKIKFIDNFALYVNESVQKIENNS